MPNGTELKKTRINEKGYSEIKETSSRELETIDKMFDSRWKTGMIFTEKSEFMKNYFNQKRSELKFLDINQKMESLQNACLDQKMSVAKIIRMNSLGYLKPLLDQLNNMYVIYVVRDPRAVLWSRQQVKKGKFSFTSANVSFVQKGFFCLFWTFNIEKTLPYNILQAC